MPNKLKSLALAGAVLLSINACTTNYNKNISPSELKEIATDASIEQKERDTALDTLKKQADNGDLEALGQLIGIADNSDKKEELSEYIAHAVLTQKQIIADAISEKLVYPENLPVGETFTTGVSVIINPDGSLVTAQVARSSGKPEMDNASTQAVIDAAPFNLIENVYPHLLIMYFLFDSKQPSK